jgi:predicted permease
MLNIFYNIVPIFALIAIGYIIKSKFLRADDFWKGCEKITYYLLFPALLINGLVSVDLSENLNNIIIPLILATLFLGFLLIGLQKVLRMDNARFTSYFQGAIRYNSYVFIGVSSALYGAKALPIVAIVIAYMIIMTNIFSVIILSVYASGKNPSLLVILKGIIKNPLVMACLVGLALNKVPFLYPKSLSTLFGFLGDASLATSLMCVGAGLRLGHLFENFKPIFLVTLAKLLVLPVISVALLYLFHVPAGLAKNIALLYAAVPCAGNAYILALQMKGDHETMAAIISTTTLAAIFTIPMVLSFL